MTWGEIKTAALQKMFLTSQDPYTSNATTRDYLGMMPAVANEGLQRLAVVGKYISKTVYLDINTDLTSLPLDFYEAIPSGVLAGGEYFRGYEILPENMIKTSYRGIVEIPYHAYPQKITKDTPDDAEIFIDPDGAVLLPLYIASELYKEDDMGMSVQWRNQFEAALGTGRGTARVIGGVVI